MEVQEKILAFLKDIGPTIPSKVAKQITTEIFLASAHLSDLASQGKVKISKLKIGGTPLYYLPGQESQLFNFAAGNMNPKNLQVLERLKDQKVMRESDLDLLGKVALRALKDFAIPLNVNAKGKIELFWKWHLLNSDETNRIISNIIQYKSSLYEQKTKVTEPEPIKKEQVLEVISEIKEEIVSVPNEDTVEIVKEEKKVEMPILNEEKVKETKPEEEKIKVEKNETKKEELKKEDPKVKVEIKEEKPKQKTLVQGKKVSPTKTVRKRKSTVQDLFLLSIETFFKEINVEIYEKESIRKNTELNFTVKVPSVVGKMTYFCKAKKKNKCDEKDISTAYMQAQIKKVPLLFLHTGDISKKAQDMLNSGAFENVIMKKIE